MTAKSMWVGSAVLFGCLMAGQALAACTPPAVSGDLDFSVCKEWPAYPGQTISAKAGFKPSADDGEGGTHGFYDLDLSVAQDGQSSPAATYHHASVYESDGVALSDMSLDTARYKLTTDLRAFGVRARFTNASRLNPMEEVQLSLYVREGATLRPVLQKLLVYQFSGEWDDDCTGQRSEMTRMVEVAKTSSHGYADLIVKTQQTGTTSAGKGEACKDSSTVYKPALTTLRYDGKSYVLPQGFKGL